MIYTSIEEFAQEIGAIIKLEEKRQRQNLELIASSYKCGSNEEFDNDRLKKDFDSFKQTF